MEGMTDFLAMGGYAAYVWPAYAVAAAVLAGLVVHSLRALRAQTRAVVALEADAPHRRRPGTEEENAT
jgi:heme exporter protein D